ncbi:hypothetical protein ACFQO9_04480 [Chryseobacterium zhengzhouense]|uniref:Uncharacterized protein n=1 Tax=Chryseobacterium zhengzhouense TaxID=1636086 RepID=A0ABW2LXH7_9FLAO
MRKYFKEYTEHLSAILLLFYILGFAYQYCYYNYFDIEIQYYVNLTDIIFSAVENLIITFLSLILIEFVFMLLSSTIMHYIYSAKNSNKYKQSQNKLVSRFDRYVSHLIDRDLKYYSFALYFVVFGTILFLIEEKFYFFSLIFPAFIYRLTTVVRSGALDLYEKIKAGIYVTTFLFLLLFYAFWGFKDAVFVTKSYSRKVIKIGKLYTGDGVNKFIGESSNYYFILDSKINSVKVINKGDVGEVIFEDNKYRIQEIKDSDRDLKIFLDQVKKELDLRNSRKKN